MPDTVEQSNQQQESKNLRILAYSVKSAIKINLINQNDEKPIMDCWIEVESTAENIADYETNYNKFRKLICMKFGPRGPNIYETILKQRTETLRLIDIKQKEKIKQQQKANQVQNTLPSVNSSVLTSQPQLTNQPVPQYSSTMYNNYPIPQHQQHHSMQQASSNPQYNYPSGYPNTQHVPPQQGYNQPLYNNIPQQQQGNQSQNIQQSNLHMMQTSSTQLSPSPQFMLPVHTQQPSSQQQQQQMYNSNALNNNQQPMLYNPNIIPNSTNANANVYTSVGSQGNNNLTNRIYGSNNPPHNQSIGLNDLKSNNFYNQNYNLNPSAPFHTIDQLNSLNAINNANNANMINNANKNISSKKTNKPEKEKKKKLSKKEEAALAALNNTNNSSTTTNKSSLTTFNTKTNLTSIGKNTSKQSILNNTIINNIESNITMKTNIPLTLEQEIDGITEKVNAIQEGLEVLSDHTIATPLITNQFIHNETETAKQRLRDNMIDQNNKKNVLEPSIKDNNDLRDLSQIPLHEDGQAWQYYNIVDKTMLALSSINILEENGLKIDISTLNVLSNGIQIHLKNILESAYKINKAKENKTSITSYDALSRMIIDHGNGNALIENKSNIAMKWGPDIYHLLKEEDDLARKLITKYNEELEGKLSEKMKLYDDEKYKPNVKRKFGLYDSIDTTPWWIIEEAAEKSGLLNITEIALNSFKTNVAKKYEYGNFINKKKIKNKPTIDSEKIPIIASTFGNNTEHTMELASSSIEINNASNDMKASQYNLYTTTNIQQQYNESELNWKHQPCPLKLPINTNIISEEDISNTISRFAYARTVQGGRNKSSTSAGTSVYKMKMGIYDSKQSK